MDDRGASLGVVKAMVWSRRLLTMMVIGEEVAGDVVEAMVVVAADVPIGL
jgi:hypothetical protein